MQFKDVDGMQDVTLESVVISNSAGTGIGILAETINKHQDAMGVKASWSLTTTASKSITGTITATVTIKINGIGVGDITNIEANDRDGRLVNAINEQTDKTGVIASVDSRGRLELKSTDGRGIAITGTNITKTGLATSDTLNYGRLTLVKLDGTDIKVSGTNVVSKIGMNTMSKTASKGSEATINLRDIKRGFSLEQADAMGMFTSKNDVAYSMAVSVVSSIASTISDNTPAVGAGVTTLEGAMAVMSIADSAIKDLDSVRSEIGSTQNQMVSTINNISVTQVNLKAAESNIRDVDFAEESANFQKFNILAQAGSYVAGQANSQQQGVMQLLR
jgi:flagellin